MKVVLINFSGNVGKSTLAAHMLHPRLGQAPVLSVESLNADAGQDGVEVDRIRGRRVPLLIDTVLTQPSVIVDVGASNCEAFLQGLQMLHGSQADFDCFVVPTVSDRKQTADTLNTLLALQALGVAADRVRVLLNRLDADDDPEERFGPLFVAAEQGLCTLSAGAVVYANEVYERIKGTGLTLAAVARDTTDYKARVMAAPDRAARHEALNRLALQRLSISANANLDRAFAALFE